MLFLTIDVKQESNSIDVPWRERAHVQIEVISILVVRQATILSASGEEWHYSLIRSVVINSIESLLDHGARWFERSCQHSRGIVVVWFDKQIQSNDLFDFVLVSQVRDVNIIFLGFDRKDWTNDIKFK
jgi:hypothetical protein